MSDEQYYKGAEESKLQAASRIEQRVKDINELIPEIEAELVLYGHCFIKQTEDEVKIIPQTEGLKVLEDND